MMSPSISESNLSSNECNNGNKKFKSDEHESGSNMKQLNDVTNSEKAIEVSVGIKGNDEADSQHHDNSNNENSMQNGSKRHNGLAAFLHNDIYDEPMADQSNLDDGKSSHKIYYKKGFVKVKLVI